jgi:transketolase
MAETLTPAELSERAINTIRFLAADAVQKANSGHPGLPMGAAAMAFVLWTRHLKFDPLHPDWPNRDRFILSAGHGSMLLYSLLHLSGSDLRWSRSSAFAVKQRTPAILSMGCARVETTTRPLGQGFSNGGHGGQWHTTPRALKSGGMVVDHHIYAIVSDGDLMEGVASEAASLAGHLRLDRLIYLYDDNRITIDGSTDLAFTEDRAARFRAYGWNVQQVEDGNDLEQVDRAIHQDKAQDRPTLIVCRTHIGYGLPTRQDTAEAHGEPPGEQELAAAKDRLGWPQEPHFLIPEEVRQIFQQAERMLRIRRWRAMTKIRCSSQPGRCLVAHPGRRLPDELAPAACLRPAKRHTTDGLRNDIGCAGAGAAGTHRYGGSTGNKTDIREKGLQRLPSSRPIPYLACVNTAWVAR